MSRYPHYGPWLAVAVVALAVVAAAGNWWYQYATTRRMHEFLGVDAAVLVAQAPAAELLVLTAHDPPETTDGAVLIGGSPRAVVRRVDLARQRGFVNFRHALRQDDGYDWSHPTIPTADSDWRYALRFHDGEKSTMLLIDRGHRWLARADLSRGVTCAAAMSDGLGKFLADATREE